jgi:uncharacterized membrane protein
VEPLSGRGRVLAAGAQAAGVATGRGGRASSVAELPAAFHLWFRWWFALGVPAFAAVIAIYWLMVAKPFAISG